MALFNLEENKKEESEKPVYTCNGECSTSGSDKIENNCCNAARDGICCIKILGSGCKSCHALLESTKEAVKTMGLSVEVEYVTDMQKVMEYSIMNIPALVVNERVVSMGKVLKSGDVGKLLYRLGF